MVYLISYEVNDNLYDYTKLVDAIKAIGPYQHPMVSLWFVSSDDTNVEEIMQELKKHLWSKYDRVYVLELNRMNNMQGWLPKAFWSWLRKETDD